MKSNSGSSIKDVKTRISVAKKKMIGLRNIRMDKNITINLKLNIIKCMIWPRVKYECKV